ncbi:ATP-binding protein [Streptomyces cyaneofuscatus]|uniref:ATP-binding protein n=1 Tax=Streptomyces cyaneofuscatus TaxID=66883 RepID=UPI0036C4FD4C
MGSSNRDARTPHVQLAPGTQHETCLMQSTFGITRRPPGELPPPEDGRQVGAIRHQAREHLSAHGLSGLADQTVLILSELVTNAIVHSGGQKVTVALSLRAGFLRIVVRDGVPSFRTPCRPSGDDDENGRGLALVEVITSEGDGAWGVMDGGSATWCELNLAAS